LTKIHLLAFHSFNKEKHFAYEKHTGVVDLDSFFMSLQTDGMCQVTVDYWQLIHHYIFDATPKTCHRHCES
jgi:hypothetical protein